MKKQQKNSARALALRIALALALTSISAILLASTLRPPVAGPQPDRPAPDVVALVGPVSQDVDLRALRYVPPTSEEDEIPLRRHPFPLAGGQIQQSPFTEQLMQRVLAPIPNMPSPILTFAGMNSTQSGCGCLPPDSDGDVAPGFGEADLADLMPDKLTPVVEKLQGWGLTPGQPVRPSRPR